jgi:hypothetical protein
MGVKRTFIIAVCFFAGWLSSCGYKKDQEGLDKLSANQLQLWNRNLTQVIMSDVFSPPVCSRIYAYCNIAAYEAARQADTGFPSYASRLNGLEPLPSSSGVDNISIPVAEVIAFTTVAKKMVFNGNAINEMETVYLKQLDSLGLEEAIITGSVRYGQIIGEHILAWASADGYLQRNANPGYLVMKNEPGRWVPTPPDYMDAVEPNWGTLRPFVMDSAAQFRPEKPLPFETAKSGELYKEMIQVYQSAAGNHRDLSEAIATFWDCNPNVSVTSGHVTYFQQRLSPGGHWIYIAASVCEKEQFGAVKTAEVMSKVAIAIADAFISCWEAKFTYNTLRPETFINKYIDKEWKPFIQTPPFPEYPSGHSTISSSAATMLTHFLGDHYEFIDSTEVPFGRPPRYFVSFEAAAQEASISRLYGGIHLLRTLNMSAEKGERMADFMIKKLK